MPKTASAKNSPCVSMRTSTLVTAGLDSLRVGVRTADRDQQVNWSTYNWGSNQPLWGLQTDVPFFLNQGVWQGTYKPHTWDSNQVGGGVYEGGTLLHPHYDSVITDYKAPGTLR